MRALFKLVKRVGVGSSQKGLKQGHQVLALLDLQRFSVFDFVFKQIFFVNASNPQIFEVR